MTDNAHDRRTLEERLQWIADWSEPGIDLADAGTAREALDRIKAQDAEIERLKRRADFMAAVAYDSGHACGLAALVAEIVAWLPQQPPHLSLQEYADAIAAKWGARPRGTECPHSPTGYHIVDTSMESGPNNCFHCEAPMPKRRM